MTVDEATALRAERQGQAYFFCSEQCRKKFLGEPFVPAPKANEQHTGSGRDTKEDYALHTDDAHQNHGEHLGPKSQHNEHDHVHDREHDQGALKSSPNAKYFCPMCSGVESDESGTCPK